MRIKLFLLSFFICFQVILLSQTNNSHGSGNSGNTIFNGNSTIATSYTRSACGLNFTYASNPLFGRTGNNFTLSVAQPASFGISGIPACAVIEKAFLYVGTSGTGVSINASITNPNSSNSIFSLALVGSGPDKHWGFTGSYTYRGDVTSIISGNGNYVISGIPTSSLLTGDDANGALLLIIYSDRTQSYTGNVVIADGNFVNNTLSGAITTTITGFNICGTPSLTTSFMLIDDQQKYDSTFVSFNDTLHNYSEGPLNELPWEFLVNPGAAATSTQTSAVYGVKNVKDTVGMLMAGMYYRSSCLVCGSLSLQATSTASCLATGTLAVTRGVAPYTYSWTGTAQTSSVVTGMSAGTQTVTVSDSLGCLSGSTTLTFSTPAAALAVTSGTACIGFSSTLTAGPTASYTWSPAGSLDNPSAQTVVASPLATTIYTINFTNALGCAGSNTAQVLVNNTQTLAIAGTNTCSGQTISLSTNSFTGDAYAWTGPASFTSSLQNPVISNATAGMSGTYNLSVTSIPGCTTTASCAVVITPASPIAVNAATICIGFGANLVAGTAASYTWSPAGSLDNPSAQTVVASPLATTIYTINFTDALGCTGTSTTQVVVIHSQTLAINGTTTCSGQNINLSTNSFTGDAYAWTGPASFTSALQNPVLSYVTPGMSGTYNLTVTSIPGCTTTASCGVLINPAPPIAVNAATTCIGFGVNLLAGLAASYTWSPAGSLNFPNIQSVIATPLATTIYTINFTDASGCTGTSTTQVVVTHTQAISINSSTLCSTQSILLSTNSFTGDGYKWLGPGGFGSTQQNPVILNSTTLMSGVYNLSVTSIPGCTSTAASNVTVFPTPSPTITSTSPICTGFNLTINGSGGAIYDWQGPNSFTSSIQNQTIANASTSVTGIYTLTASFASGCTATITKSLVVQPLPVPVINTTTNVCVGRPATFSATPSGFPIYQWAGPNSFTSNLQVVTIPSISLLSNGVYTLTVKDVNNCQASATTTMAALINPTVSATGTTVCFGAPATLTANGLGFFTWLGPNGYSTTPVVPFTTISVVNNLSVGVYTVILTSTSNSCSAQATTTLLTIPLPTVVATGSIVCLNEPATLTVTGAPNYAWTGPNGYIATGPNPIIPLTNSLTTGVYSVIGTAANTCTSSATASIGTIPLPTVTATGTLNCLKEPFTFTANGAVTYSWVGPSSYTAIGSTAYVPITNSLSTGIYTVVGTALNTCTNVTTATLASIPLPTVTTISQTVCLNSPATLTAAGATTYSWTGPGAYTATGPNAFIPSANSVAAQIYTVIGREPTTCTNVATATLVTMPLPTVTATGTIICYGEPFTIAINGAATYTWTGPNSYNVTGPGGAYVPVVDFTSTGIYSVIGTAVNTCTGSTTAALGTLPLPVVTAAGTLICLNEPFTLTAGGAQGYVWTGPNSYAASGYSAYIPNANSLSTGIYTVIGTAVNTCTSAATATLGTLPLPVITTTGQTVCLNSPATLTAAGAAAYTWRGPGSYTASGQTAFIQSANNIAAQVYTVLGMAANTCTNTATVSLFTIPLPTISATGTVICFGEPFTILANGAFTYTWTGPNYGGNGAAAFIPTVNVSSSGIYTVSGTAVTGCTAVATAVVGTLPLPIITTTGTSVCYLQPATLMAGGGISTGYSWTGPGGYTASSAAAFIPVASSHLPQTYSVVGTGANSCTNSATAILNTYYLPLPGYNVPSAVCFGAYINLQGFGASTYTWTGPRHYISANQNVSFPIYNIGQEGTYTLSVTDSLGCKNDTTAQFSINPLPEGILVSDNSNNFCVPFCSDFKLQRTTASPIVTSTWTYNDTTVFSSESFRYCAVKAQSDTIMGTFSDVLGCTSTRGFIIESHPVPVANFIFYPEKPVANTDQVAFTNTSSGEQLTAWNWYFVDNNGYISSGENTFYTFEDAGENSIAMIVTNTWGCKDTIIKEVLVESDIRLYVPNVFTPNNDGLNDTFKPKGAGFSKYVMVIYDRWGEKMFESTDLETGWDGKLHGNLCKDDVYTWRIHTVNIQGVAKEQAGNVTLAR